MTTFPQTILFEQHHLQGLWNRREHIWNPADVQRKNRLMGNIRYVSNEGWWIVWQDNHGETRDLIFLGRTVEEAQRRVTLN